MVFVLFDFGEKIVSLQETLVRSTLLQLKVDCFLVHTWHLQLNCKTHSILLHVCTCSLCTHYISICSTADLEGKSPIYLSIALNIMQPSWASSSLPSSDLMMMRMSTISLTIHCMCIRINKVTARQTHSCKMFFIQ